MKTPHLCWALDPPSSFEPLVAAARALDLRVGWLRLGSFATPPELEPARDAGLARAVAAGGGASLAFRPIAGEPVLGDLLRGHFLGCRLVLLEGDAVRPGVRIDPRLPIGRLSRVAASDEQGARWKLVSAEGRERVLDTEQLAARLRRPRL